jgi:acetolactate synthase-1/2/3 large subunit
MITNLLEKRSHENWLNGFKECMKQEVEAVIHEEMHPTSDVMTMGEVIDQLNELTKGDAVIVTDVGQHQMVACRYAKFTKSKSNITSGGLGTMGFALPAAIGAKLGNSSKTVVAIIGDGGFQMTIQELGTILQFKIDVKILILNNNFLGMVRQWQELFFEKRYSFTDIVNPNFTQIAKGYDIEALKIDQRTELSEALDTMLSSKAAYLLEVVVEQEENVFPMVATGASVSEIRLK